MGLLMTFDTLDGDFDFSGSFFVAACPCFFILFLSFRASGIPVFAFLLAGFESFEDAPLRFRERLSPPIF